MAETYLNHLNRQYEFLTKHLEYHDSTIFKSLSIYFLFSGAFIAKIDLFIKQQSLSAMLVGIVGIVFSLMLLRTAILLTDLKNQIDEVETEICNEFNRTKISSISQKYLGRGLWKATRTSVVGSVLVALLTGFLVCFLLNKT
ncbi:MAG: hypothetical protein HAW67_01055 [Endozoicomonadaceae bacterium]|nr:hypothetical protein [Endozoicomonadaceae bacterium]